MSLPDAPNTLREKYYSVMAGQNDADILPDIDTAPSTENRYLDYIARNGGGGGGDVTKDYVDEQDAKKTDKVTSAISGNFAGLDENGNLTDSGKTATDFATASDMSDVQGVIPSTATTQNKLATAADVTDEDISSTSTASPLTDSADGYVQGINVKGHSHKNKNLLEITATTQTKNGVTFTVNSDRTVTIHGTASGNAVFQLVTSGTLSEYDGCIAVVDPTVYTPGVSMNLELVKSPWTAYVKTGKLPQTINYNGNNDEKYLFLRVIDGVTADTTFKPMICTVADYERDPSYEPYVGGGIKSIGDNDFTIITTDSTETLTSTATITTGLPLRSTLDGTVYDELTNEKVITRCEVVEGEVVPLATPTETPLTSAEIAALAALQTYNSTTHIDATDAPTMTVDYLLNTDNGQAVADIQKDLQEQIDDLSDSFAETVLYDNMNLMVEPAANVQLNLSQPYTNFDEIKIEYAYIYTGAGNNKIYPIEYRFSVVDLETIRTSSYNGRKGYLLFDRYLNFVNMYISMDITSTSILTIDEAQISSNVYKHYITKITGIKY